MVVKSRFQILPGAIMDSFFDRKSKSRKSEDPTAATHHAESVIVAEISFDRNASPEELRRLGEALESCRKSQEWIANISGLDALMRGECPDQYSKAILNSGTGELTPFFDPILVWGRLDYHGKEVLNPIEILRDAIPPVLGRVNYPDPDGGL
jgi:hypothetical protein